MLVLDEAPRLIGSVRDLLGIYPPGVPGGRGQSWTHGIHWEIGKQAVIIPHSRNEEINESMTARMKRPGPCVYVCARVIWNQYDQISSIQSQ